MGLLKVDTEFLNNYTSMDTRRSYLSDIRLFFDYLITNTRVKSLTDISRSNVIEYRNWLSEFGGHNNTPAAPKSIARKLASLSSYFDYIVEKGFIENNPVNSVKRPRHEVKTPTQALTNDQVTELINSIDDSTKPGIMHKALLLTFFMTGMRKSEVIKLQFKHFREINDLYIFEYTGKGGKIGQKVIHPICLDAIENYLSMMRAEKRAHQHDDFFFQPTKNPSGILNKSLNPKTINEIIEKYGKKIGLNFKVSPHSARATFISALLDQGVDIYEVAKEVKHSSVKTTQEYDKRRTSLQDSPILKLRY